MSIPSARERNNYKAKYLAATQTPSTTELKEKLSTVSDQITNTQQETVRKLHILQQQTIETANRVKTLVNVLDTYPIIAGCEFERVHHPIDDKLQQNDSINVLKRTKDVVQLASTRIGVLSEALMAISDSYTMLRSELDKLSGNVAPLSVAAAHSLLIGPDPTRTELENYNPGLIQMPMNRFGIEYEELDEDASIFVNDKATNIKPSTASTGNRKPKI